MHSILEAMYWGVPILGKLVEVLTVLVFPRFIFLSKIVVLPNYCVECYQNYLNCCPKMLITIIKSFLGIPLYGSNLKTLKKVESCGFGVILHKQDLTGEHLLKTIERVLNEPRSEFHGRVETITF